MKRGFTIFAVGMMLSLGACNRYNKSTLIDPPSTPPLSRPIGFAVIINSYAQIFDKPGDGGISLGYLRRGTILPVAERCIIKNGENSERWIMTDGDEDGWLPEDDVGIYTSAAAAKTAADRLAQ